MKKKEAEAESESESVKKMRRSIARTMRLRRRRRLMKKPPPSPAIHHPLQGKTVKDYFRWCKSTTNIRAIAVSAIIDHNAIKGTHMRLVSVVKARVMKELIGALYHLTLHVKEPTDETIVQEEEEEEEEEEEDNPKYKESIIQKMVWVGESRETIINSKSELNDFYTFDLNLGINFTSLKYQKLAQFALDEFNTRVAGGYDYKLKDLENVEISLRDQGSQIYRKGPAGYSVFEAFLFDIKVLEGKRIPPNFIELIPYNLIVVTKRWQQTLDDEKADFFLHNLSFPRNYPVIEWKLHKQIIATRPLLEVSLKSPMLETMAWFAVEDELFKRRTRLEFVQVVYGTVRSCSGKKYNLTIEARDQGVLKEFYTSVWERKWLGICITAPFKETTTPSKTLLNSGAKKCCCITTPAEETTTPSETLVNSAAKKCCCKTIY